MYKMLIFRAVFILLVLAILSIGVYMIALQSTNHKRCYENTEHFEYIDNTNIEAGIKIPQIQTDDFSINKNFIVGSDKNYSIKATENIEEPVEIPKIKNNTLETNNATITNGNITTLTSTNINNTESINSKSLKTNDINIANSITTKNTATTSLSVNGKNIFDIIYPIGYIYISYNDTNPSKLFGFGTWEQLPENYYLMSGKKQGEYGGSSKITVDNLPAHAHNYAVSDDRNGYPDGSKDTSGGGAANQSYWRGNKNLSSNNKTTTNTGGGKDYWPRYYKLFCYRRVK